MLYDEVVHEGQSAKNNTIAHHIYQYSTRKFLLQVWKGYLGE
jgi:hypothetical protein